LYYDLVGEITMAFDKHPALQDAKIHDGVMYVDLWYPKQPDGVKAIEIGLMAVRASDGIRIEYDFDRDGWVIKQPGGDSSDWQEVAFVESWARSPED
jgi:hypothetical protein